MEFQAGQKVIVGAPASPPAETVINRVVDEARRMPQVRALYLAQVVVGQHSGPAIGVDSDVTKEQESALFEQLGSAVQPLLREGEGVDFLITRGSVGESIRTNGKQIYATKR